MKKTETRIVCDLCPEPRSSAEIRCDKHHRDLCTSHMRAHFDRRKCRLLPMDRKSTVSENLSEKIIATIGKLRKPQRHAALRRWASLAAKGYPNMDEEVRWRAPVRCTI